MKILVTGAAGFVGSYLSQHLIRQNYEVDLLDNYYLPSNITEIAGVKIQHRDVRDSSLDCSTYDVVFHLAAIAGIKACEDNKHEAYSVNVGGTQNILKTLKGKIIFASTSALYGVCKDPEITEKHPIDPRSYYGETKMLSEDLITAYGKYVILRFSNIYGHGIFHKRTVTDLFIENSLNNKPLIIQGSGNQRRDFVHIHDCLCAYWNAFRSDNSNIYNIGGDEALSVKDIAYLVQKHYRNIFGFTPVIKYEESRNEPLWKDFIYVSDKAKNLINYQPTYTVGDEIRNRFAIHKRKTVR